MAEIDNEVPEKLSHNHPLFLNSNDNSGAILISLQLRDLKKYSVWSHAMRIAILGQNKLGLIDEFDSLALVPGCDCEKSREFVVFMERLKLLQFLIGLTESYDQARSQLLIMISAPSVNKAYSMIMERESHRTIVHTNVPIENHDITALVSARGHTRENCYKLDGYPVDFKHKKKGGIFPATNFAGNNGGYGHNTGSPMHTTGGHESFSAATFAANSTLLNNLDKDSSLKDGKVHLPTSNVVSISNTWTFSIFRGQEIQNNLFSRQVMGIGREDCGLYYLKPTLTQVQLSAQLQLQKSNREACDSVSANVPLSNGVVEKNHRSILNVTRPLRFQGVIPVKFWGECAATAIYLLNRLPSVILQNKSTFEMLHSHPPNLGHLRTFGCLAYASNPSVTDKMSPKAIPSTLMGEDLFPFKHFTPSTLSLFPVLEPSPDHPKRLPNTAPDNTTIAPPT
nr:uncharacterized protein LOC104112804 [Nicotiana tomentosiformis]